MKNACARDEKQKVREAEPKKKKSLHAVGLPRGGDRHRWSAAGSVGKGRHVGAPLVPNGESVSLVAAVREEKNRTPPPLSPPRQSTLRLSTTRPRSGKNDAKTPREQCSPGRDVSRAVYIFSIKRGRPLRRRRGCRKRRRERHLIETLL